MFQPFQRSSGFRVEIELERWEFGHGEVKYDGALSMDVREGRGGGGEEQTGGIFGDLSSLSPTGVSSSHFCP